MYFEQFACREVLFCEWKKFILYPHFSENAISHLCRPPLNHVVVHYRSGWCF